MRRELVVDRLFSAQDTIVPAQSKSRKTCTHPHALPARLPCLNNTITGWHIIVFSERRLMVVTHSYLILLR